MVNRPEWYKTLRLVHRGLIKYLSNKTVAANDLLLEIKEKLNELGIKNIGIENKFEIDIQYAFWEICNRYNVDSDIIVLFEKLFENFNDNNYFCKRCGSKE
ncbi:hypothetical protein SH1V18_33870 [Vallitalea longa]|uniref:Uncharacterized protein n=1 Tax=Vallitalea longa TaxID=2936439 RepID=A0A9W5YBF6_9FIRM|nr:hypothetical protein [Vallitalea longa]GKX30907.1 hypothetical protein SH1V18_33870 [Vallitalea longa]